MKPLVLNEDRSPAQLAADGDAQPHEAVPCGRIASATHCCEYHAIHSDDDLEAAIALLRRVNGARWFHGDPLHGDIVAFLSRICRQGTSTVLP